MSDLPTDDTNNDDVDQTLPQSGVHPIDDDLTLEQDAVDPSCMDDDLTLEQDAVNPMAIDADAVTLEQDAVDPSCMDDADITLPQSGVHPVEEDADVTLPQSGVHPVEDDADMTLPQSGVHPTTESDDDLTLEQSAVRPVELDDDGEPTEQAHYIDKYPVSIKLGQGGMGIVWLGHHPDLDIKVAIKTLPTHLISRDPAFVERFIKEARTAARINHPNVVRIYDAGNDDDTHYIVMEFVGGGSVHELINEKGALPLDDALEMMIQTAEGLKAAAEFNIIHRDIKPENIMLDEKGTPKLADLGLAKQIDADEMSMTGTGMAVGTPSYMAPEQVQDAKSCDARADIYSLGATFYHMITGAVPFSASSAFDMMLKHVQEPLPPPQEKKPDIPDNVNAVICKMLEKSPDLRYQTAEELLGDLRMIKYGDAPLKKLLAGQLKKPTTVGATASAPPTGKSASPKKKSMLPWVALFCLLAAGAGAYMLKDKILGTDEPKEIVDNDPKDKPGDKPDDKINPKPVDPKPVDPKPVDPKPVDPKPVDPKPVDPKPVDPKPVDPKPVDPKPVDPKPVDPKPVDPKPVDPKPVDPKPVDPKPVDPKPVDPKPVDPKPVDPKPVDPKPRVTPRLGKPIPLELVGDQPQSKVVAPLKLNLVPLKSGSFMMGSDIGATAIKPAHTVSFARPFWMGATEVTATQFASFTRATKYKTTAETVGFSMQIERTLKKTKRARLYWKSASKGSQPVACVSRDDATAFCNWLNSTLVRDIPVGYEYRLPTEAEWEYAARCGMKGAYGHDSLSEKLLSYAWYMENSRGKLQPVGTLKSNRWKLYDMHGNVSEWCLDAYGDYAKGDFTDPVRLRGTEFVLRGGGHVSFSEDCEGTARKAKSSDYSATNVGFRIVLAPVVAR